jgi:hypothetical protein
MISRKLVLSLILVSSGLFNKANAIQYVDSLNNKDATLLLEKTYSLGRMSSYHYVTSDNKDHVKYLLKELMRETSKNDSFDDSVVDGLSTTDLNKMMRAMNSINEGHIMNK